LLHHNAELDAALQVFCKKFVRPKTPNQKENLPNQFEKLEEKFTFTPWA
jgi:hypothetical protein